jgi:hypothetical protein
MNLIFNDWPEEHDVTEVWLTKIEGEGMITQASLDFDRRSAEEKAAALNEGIPALATVLGPFVLATSSDS